MSEARIRTEDLSIDEVKELDIKSNKGGTRAFALYDCFRYTLEDFKEKARVLKDGCFLVEVLPAENENNYEYLYQIKKYAKEAGFIYYSKVPWKKGTFVSNTGRKAKNTQDIIHFLRREMLDFTAFPVFFVSNLLLVQRKKYYFNRAMVSRNCSIVL